MSAQSRKLLFVAGCCIQLRRFKVLNYILALETKIVRADCFTLTLYRFNLFISLKLPTFPVSTSKRSQHAEGVSHSLFMWQSHLGTAPILNHHPPSSCIIISCSCRQSEESSCYESSEIITIKNLRRELSARPQKQSEQTTYENRRFPRIPDENIKTLHKRASSLIKKLQVCIYTWEQPTNPLRVIHYCAFVSDVIVVTLLNVA